MIKAEEKNNCFSAHSLKNCKFPYFESFKKCYQPLRCTQKKYTISFMSVRIYKN